MEMISNEFFKRESGISIDKVQQIFILVVWEDFLHLVSQFSDFFRIFSSILFLLHLALFSLLESLVHLFRFSSQSLIQLLLGLFVHIFIVLSHHLGKWMELGLQVASTATSSAAKRPTASLCMATKWASHFEAREASTITSIATTISTPVATKATKVEIEWSLLGIALVALRLLLLLLRASLFIFVLDSCH